MIETKLYRSKNERMIAGVCGGLAEYLDIDPVIIRLIWVIITCFAFSGIIIYIIACLIIPNEIDDDTIIESDKKKVDIR